MATIDNDSAGNTQSAYGGGATVDVDSAGRNPGLGADHVGVALDEGLSGIPSPTNFSVVSISPAVGALAGGTAVTITGTGFTATPTVTFGGVSATSIVLVNANTITCNTPAKTVGSYTVLVTNPDSSSGTTTFFYGVSVTAITPSSGSTSGGSSVTITGNGFLTGATVTIGGSSATSVTVNSATSITCTTPAHASGATNVVVTNTNTNSGTLTSGYTYGANPVTVTSLSVTTGVDAGGTATTITGTGFASGATVTFGGDSATSVVVVNSTTITCVTPAHAAGAVSVVVTNTDTGSGTLSNAFTYSNSPLLDTVSPSVGKLAGGTAVTLSGQFFVATPTVTFGGVSATSIVRVSAGVVTCVTPANSAGAVSIVLTNPDGGTATLASSFTYTAVTATSLSQASGGTNGGTVTTLTGAGYYTGATITVGGVAATSVTVNSSTSITFTTPAGSAGAKDVVVTNLDGGTATLVGGFTYSSGGVTVDSLDVTSGPIDGATAVTITGSGFLASPTVTFGGTSATSVVRVNSTTITCVTPAKAVGTYNVVVTNTDTTTGTLTNGFTYTLKDSLIAWYNLTELSGARADSHTGGYTLADNNGVLQIGGLKSTTQIATRFTGSNGDRITVPNSSTYQTGNTDFSWAGWTWNTGANRTILSKSSGSNLYEYKIAWLGQKITFSVSANSASTQTTVTSPTTIANSTWTFVCCTYTASTRTLSVSTNNETAVTGTTTVPNTPTTNTADLLLVGELTTAPSTFAAGLAGPMQAWGLWKKVLSPSEITSLYNGGVAKLYSQLDGTLTTNLAAFWNFTEGTVANGGTFTESVSSATHTYTCVTSTTTRIGIYGDHVAAYLPSDKTGYLSSQFTPLDNITTNFSVAFWCAYDNISGTRTLIYKGGRTATEAGFSIQKNGAPIKALFSNGTTLASVQPSNSLTTLGNWIHVAATFDRAGSMKVYINGALGTGTNSASISAITGSMGSIQLNVGGVLNTVIAAAGMEKLGFWSKVLSSGEVSSLYNSGSGRTYSQL